MSRRGNGEGSEPAWVAAKGYFQGQIALGGKRYTCTGKTKAEVRRKYADRRRRHEDGQPVVDSRQKVASWVETWRTTTLPAARSKGKLAQATVDLYEMMARTHVVEALGEKAISSVRKADIDALYLDLVGRGYSQSTLRNLHAVLRWIFREAEDNELVKVSPMAKVERPAAGGKRAGFLDREQAARLVTALETSPMLLDYTKLMLLTGFRRGEGLGLLWEHVGDTHLEVALQLTRASDGLRLRPVKTEAGERHVSISEPLADVLRNRRRAQLRDRMAAPAGTWSESVEHEDGGTRTGLVFTTALGGPLEPRNVARAFTTAVAKAGLPADVTIHTLRHSAASFLLAAGVPMKVVQKILGHSSMAITSDIYSHVAPELETEAASKLGEALGW